MWAYFGAALDWLSGPKVGSIAAVIAAVAALLTLGVSWRQLRQQAFRWRVEDERLAPRALVLTSAAVTSAGWFHGVFSVTNQLAYKLDLVRVDAVRPWRLRISLLKKDLGGNVKDMEPVKSTRHIDTRGLLKEGRAPGEHGITTANFLYRIPGDPRVAEGTQIRLRFIVQEPDYPHRKWKLYGSAVVPKLMGYDGSAM